MSKETDEVVSVPFEKLKDIYIKQTEAILPYRTIQEFCNILDDLKNLNTTQIHQIKLLTANVEMQQERIDALTKMRDIYEDAIMTAAKASIDFFGDQELPKNFHILIAYAAKIEEMRETRQEQQ